MSTIKISDDDLNTFYNQNPDFDILQFNLLNGQVNSLNWEGVEQETTLKLLKKYQRLLRINPNPEIAKRLLNTSLSQQAEQTSAPSSPTTNIESVSARSPQAARSAESSTEGQNLAASEI